MKPSGVLNFENVPADAGDPDVKVYVNGDLVESGGGGASIGKFVTVNLICDDTYDEVYVPCNTQYPAGDVVCWGIQYLTVTDGKAKVLLLDGAADDATLLYSITAMKGEFYYDGTPVSATGGCEIVDNQVLVTDDGTVTLTFTPSM